MVVASEDGEAEGALEEGAHLGVGHHVRQEPGPGFAVGGWVPRCAGDLGQAIAGIVGAQRRPRLRSVVSFVAAATGGQRLQVERAVRAVQKGRTSVEAGGVHLEQGLQEFHCRLDAPGIAAALGMVAMVGGSLLLHQRSCMGHLPGPNAVACDPHPGLSFLVRRLMQSDCDGLLLDQVGQPHAGPKRPLPPLREVEASAIPDRPAAAGLMQKVVREAGCEAKRVRAIALAKPAALHERHGAEIRDRRVAAPGRVFGVEVAGHQRALRRSVRRSTGRHSWQSSHSGSFSQS